MNRIITIAAIKGGTGKSTTAAALAQAAAADGKRVLVIDLEPQANSTFFLAANQNLPGSYQLLHGTPAAQVIQTTEQGIDVIAGGPDLQTEETTPASAKRLQSAIGPIKESYDLIIIDTPPAMGELTFNALQAATGLIVPIEADSNGLQGLYQIVDIAKQIKARSNPGLQKIGTVLTRYDGKANVDKALKDHIAAAAQEMGAPLLTEIKYSSAAVRGAQTMQYSLFEYAPKSKPAQDYKRLYKIIMQEG